MKVLFIGNSQMQCYDLPRMIEVMAQSAPADHPRIESGQVLIGGGTLKKHWDAGEGKETPRTMIATGKWDFVVIQEIYCANEPEFEKFAEMFDELIKKNRSKTILFATAGVTRHYNAAMLKYPDAFEKLNDMQIAFGKKRGIPVAAAGYAWMKYLGPNPSEAQLLDLYHKDKGHPGPKGTYIYACLLYAFITGLNPAGLTSEFKDARSNNQVIPGDILISKKEAANMQKAAWEQYQASIHNKPGN